MVDVDIASLQESIYLPVVFVVGGIIIAFIGRTLLKIAIMIIGGGLLSYGIYYLAGVLGIGLVPAIVLAIIGFIVGAVIGWFLIKIAVSIAVGITLGMILAVVLGLQENTAALVITVLLAMGLTYILAEKIIEFAMSVLGGVMVFYGISIAYPTLIGRQAGIALGFIVFFLSIYYHHRGKKKKEKIREKVIIVKEKGANKESVEEIKKLLEKEK